MSTDPCLIIAMLMTAIVCLWVCGQAWDERW